MLVSDEDIKTGSTDGKVLGTVIVHLDGITLGIDVGTDLGSLEGSYGKIPWLLWWPKSCSLNIIFLSVPHLIYVGNPCSNLGKVALFLK